LSGEHDREKRRAVVEKAVLDGITRTTARDQQKGIGPSEIGQDCDFCVGLALTRRYPQLRRGVDAEPVLLEESSYRRFSLKAWTGTATHEKLERDVEFPGLLKEHTFEVYWMEGYGQIVGHVDAAFLEQLTALDYKTKDVAKIRYFKLNGVPQKEAVQLMLYGWALERAGHPVEDVGLCYIPRDSNTLGDIWTAFAVYRSDYAERALERLEKLWQRVRSGDLAALERDPECYECNQSFRI